MSDYYHGEIYIPAAFVTPELEKIIRAEAGAPEVTGRENGTVISYSAGDLAYGEFNNTEEYCINNHIPFDRHTDGSYEYDPYVLYFRPAEGKTPEIHVERLCNQAMQHYVPAEKIIELSNTIFDDNMSKLETLDQLNTLLKTYSDTGIRPLKTYIRTEDK